MAELQDSGPVLVPPESNDKYLSLFEHEEAAAQRRRSQQRIHELGILNSHDAPSSSDDKKPSADVERILETWIARTRKPQPIAAPVVAPEMPQPVAKSQSREKRRERFRKMYGLP